jgi:hypothetical protein
MPIQNVNAAAETSLVSTAEKVKSEQTAPEKTVNNAKISANADTLIVSPQAEELRAQHEVDSSGPQREADLDTVYSMEPTGATSSAPVNTELTGIENGAVPEKQPTEGVAKQDVMENRTEQLAQRQETQETNAQKRDTTNQNNRLDLTV